MKNIRVCKQRSLAEINEATDYSNNDSAAGAYAGGLGGGLEPP